MKIIFTHIQGSRAGTKTEHESPVIRVGRDPRECELVFNSLQEPGVSRQHAIISLFEGNFFLEDLNSRNGTFLDNVQIHGKVPLKAGNVIQFGIEGPIVQFDFDAKYRSKAPSTRPAVKLETKNSTLLEEATIPCPVCSTPCSLNARFCRRCGKSLLPGVSEAIDLQDDPEITLAPMSKEEREALERKRIIEVATESANRAAQAAIAAMRTCAVCGANIAGEAKFCAVCGALIHADSANLFEDKSLTPQPVATAYVSMDKLLEEDKSIKKEKKPKTKSHTPTIADLEEELFKEGFLSSPLSANLSEKPSEKVSEKSVEVTVEKPFDRRSAQPKIEIPHAQRQGPLIPPNPIPSPVAENKSKEIFEAKPILSNNVTSVSQQPKNERSFSPGYTLLLSAQALAKEGRTKIALDECERALRLDPHLPEVYKFMGQMHLSLGESEKAIECFEKAIEMEPSFAETYAEIGQAYLRAGRYEDAAKSAHEAVKINQINPSAFYTIGHALMEMGDYTNAFEAFNRAIKLQPDYPEAYLGIANIQFRAGRADEAVKSCQQAVKIRPNYPQAYCLLGQSYRAVKKFTEAQQALKDAIKLKPDYSIAYNYLALNYRSQGNLDEAEAACYKAIALDPNLPENHNTMGLLYGERGDYTDAVTEYKKALDLRPNYAEAHNNLGLCFFKTNDLDGAIKYFEKAVELEPQFVLARINLALCYFKKRDKDNVKKHYDILYEQDETRAAKLYQKIKPLLIS